MQKCRSACVSLPPLLHMVLPAQFNGWNLQKSTPLGKSSAQAAFLGLHVDFCRSDPILQPSHKFSVWGRSDDVRRASLLVLLEILLRVKNSDTFSINLKKHLKHHLQTKTNLSLSNIFIYELGPGGVASKSHQLQKEGIRLICIFGGRKCHHGFHLGRSMDTQSFSKHLVG